MLRLVKFSEPDQAYYRRLECLRLKFIHVLFFSACLISTLLGQNNQKQISFQYTGRSQSWFVPSCVTRIKIEVWGAQGGSSMTCFQQGTNIQNDGGLGGYTSGELDVMNGQLLYIMVGGQGKTGRNWLFDGGFNGGGDGGMYAAGGGGATDIRTLLNDLDSRLIVAAGGGGGNSGCPDVGTGGAGGGIMGDTGVSLLVWGAGAGGGSQIAGGTAGFSGGEAGTYGVGGHAGMGGNQFHIAGGGGGWYGGGSAYGTGGGGGSSMFTNMFFPHVQNGSTLSSQRSGNGFVVITLLEGADCVYCELLCNAKVNISMPANECYRVIRPEEVLAKTNSECTTFGFGLSLSYPFGTSRLYGNDVDRTHLGYTLIYTVQDGSNSCWGYFNIEDKSAPVAGCHGTQNVSCYQLFKLLDVTSQVIDNCSAKNKATIEQLKFTDFGCDNMLGVGRIDRTIRTQDVWGNSSICSDTLYIQKDSIFKTNTPDLITLSCKMICKTIGDQETQSDFEEIIFSKNPSNKYYPTPELLLRLQHQDTVSGDQPCISTDLHAVPYIYDSVLVWEDGAYHKEWLPVDQYPFKSGFCKVNVTYSDELIEVCQDGSSFKIRRQWRLSDWCTGEEKLLIQYIEIADHAAPALFMDKGGLDPRDNRLQYLIDVDVHSCLGEVQLKELVLIDCSPSIKQHFTASYTDISHPGKTIVQQGFLPAKLKLPAVEGIYGVRDHYINVSLVDGCFNKFDTTILVQVKDETPPEILVDGPTRLTVDPATCWSRVYAKDLDNGSRDNCCNVLHFAIATMDSINAARKYVYDAIIEQCGYGDYIAKREYYDFYIEDYISSYIFKDYLDLYACEEYQIVVRVWEACGIPRFDPHIWPCSEHHWFLYNAGYPRTHYRADHNLNFGFSRNADYSKFKAPKDCNWRYPLIFCDPLLAEWFAVVGVDDFITAYEGAGAAELCNFDFYFPRLGLLGNSINGNSSNNPPGNTCSRMLWKDGMVLVTVDDKTPPVAENPEDVFWYCDNVSTAESDQYEYARCNDDIYGNENAKDHTCIDVNNKSYNEIECHIENDGNLLDTIDSTGTAFGWYGCNTYGLTHRDEHGDVIPCESGYGNWAPVYCHSWLCLDAYDRAGKIDPATAFAAPLFNHGSPGSTVDGDGHFLIWDNCNLDTSSLVVKNSSIVDQCGNGWLLRTWTINDECGNEVSVDQKITTKHRSDFEALFPVDVVSFCGNPEELNPEALGKPIVNDDECELVGINYSDEIFDIVEEACYKIVRTWRIIDWCKYDLNNQIKAHDVLVDDRLTADTIHRPCVYRHIKDNGDGHMIYVQIIKVIDTLAPQVHCRDTTICIDDPACMSPSIQISFDATDYCTPNQLITYRWELDENPAATDLAARTYNKTSINKKSEADVKKLVLTQVTGTSLVHVIAGDRCGNEDTCTLILTVKDCKKPTPYCYNGIATVVMSPSGSISVWASDLDAGSYDNCTLKPDLTFSFGQDSTKTKKEFTCSDIPNGKSAAIPVEVYVWDKAGLYDYCKTYILLQDGLGNSCPDNLNGTKNKAIGSLPLSKAPIKIEIPGRSPQVHSIKSGTEPRMVLLQNQPNPFNSFTWIPFTLTQPETFTLMISDLSGRVIWKQKETGRSGLNRIRLMKTDLRGPGVYYYTLETQEMTSTRKMIITY